MLILAIVLTMAVEVTTQTPAMGSLVGCISDRSGFPLPGVTILAKGDGVQRTTEADKVVCYEFIDLPSASYRITARLAGFDNVTRDRVVLGPRTVTHFDVTMSVSPKCGCIQVGVPPRSLAEAWQQAGAVLHVRITEPEPGSPIHSGTYRHVATVLHALKFHIGEPSGATTAVVEYQRNGAPGPYDVGQELVIFPKWESTAWAFYAVGLDCCDRPGIVFVLRDGRVERAPSEFSRYVGMPTNAFLDELHAAARGK
jgi:hypothetical protein